MSEVYEPKTKHADVESMSLPFDEDTASIRDMVMRGRTQSQKDKDDAAKARK